MIFPQQQKPLFLCMFWTDWAEHEWWRRAAYRAEFPVQRRVGRKREEREGEKEEKPERRAHERPWKDEKQQKGAIMPKKVKNGVF